MSVTLKGQLALVVNGEDVLIELDESERQQEDDGRWVIERDGFSIAIRDSGGEFDLERTRAAFVEEIEIEHGEDITVEVNEEETDFVVEAPELFENPAEEEDDEAEDEDA